MTWKNRTFLEVASMVVHGYLVDSGFFCSDDDHSKVLHGWRILFGTYHGTFKQTTEYFHHKSISKQIAFRNISEELFPPLYIISFQVKAINNESVTI